jgi:hypothetical protein
VKADSRQVLVKVNPHDRSQRLLLRPQGFHWLHRGRASRG